MAVPPVRRVLVTGGGGYLGGWLRRTVPDGVELHATRRRTAVPGALAHTVDLADRAACDRLLRELRPDLVLHTAYGKADGARDILAASSNVATAVAGVGAQLVHLSSDVVFDGEHAPYHEHDTLAPVEDYGRWKARAEEAVTAACPEAAVVRTSLICSVEPPDHALVELEAALRSGRRPTLYTDELRCPIWGQDLALALWELVGLPGSERAGPWHVVGPEAVSRYTLGCLMAVAAGLPPAFDAAPNSTAPQPRARDLRLGTARAEQALATRPRPIGEVLAAGRRTARGA